jgi:E3 ubiquitin-protein ligase UHRF1
MGVIESLQRQAEEEKMDENSEGCSEEIDNAIEQPDLVSDAVNDPIAEEPKDDSQKA